MSIYLFPQTMCDDIQKMLNSFWWGSKNRTSKGINWLSWDKLSMRKECGGLGFYDLQAFNLALLAKQGWKFINDPNALVTRVFKAKYFPHVDFLEANLGHNPSYYWHSVWCSQSLLKEGMRWRIGDGSRIHIWDQPWLRDDGRTLQSPPIACSETLTLRDLRTYDSQA